MKHFTIAMAIGSFFTIYINAAPSFNAPRFMVHLYVRAWEDLTSIPENIPAIVTAIRLERNYITSVNGCVFCNLPSLGALRISSNQLEYIDSNAFVNTSLEMINLQYNRVNKFPNFCSVGDTLSVIQAAYNNIKYVNETHLQCLKTMMVLDLKSNPLFMLPDVQVLPNKNLVEYLGYSGQISDPIRKEYFIGLANLTYLNIGETGINEVPDLSLLPVPNKLQELVLGSVSRVPSHIGEPFLQNISLTALRLTDNGNAIQQSSSYIGDTLQTLTCHLCRREQVILPFYRNLSEYSSWWDSNHPFPDLRLVNRTLETWACYNSRFSDKDNTWMVDALGTLETLKSIIMASCVIPPLPDLPKIVPTLTSLVITNMALQCDCSMLWLKDAQLRTNSNLSVTTNDVKCNSPPRLSEKNWDSLSREDLKCMVTCDTILKSYQSYQENKIPDKVSHLAMECEYETMSGIALQEEQVTTKGHCLLVCILNECKSFFFNDQTLYCVTFNGTFPDINRDSNFWKFYVVI